MAILKEIESFETQFKEGKKTEKDALSLIINLLTDIEKKIDMHENENKHEFEHLKQEINEIRKRM